MRMSTITIGGPGLVAVGWDERGAAAWTSSDGQTWEPVPPEELGPGTINDVTAVGPGLVAVGTTDNELRRIQGTQPGGPSQGVVWTSEDGRTWTRFDDLPVIRDADFGPSDITAGGPGVVAVGAQNRAWFSSDGLAWEAASVPSVPDDVYPGDDGRHPQIYMTDVASSGDRLLALGTALLKGGGPPPEYETWIPVMWTSADGRSWTDVPVDPEVFPREGSIDALTHGPGGFVAVGSDGDRPAVWRSADGLGWHRVSSKAFASRVALPGRSSAMWSIAASELGYVAVGVDGFCEIECRSVEAAIWTSKDGESWTRVSPGDVFKTDTQAETGAQAWQVVAWGSRFVVEGEYDGRDSIWVSRWDG